MLVRARGLVSRYVRPAITLSLILMTALVAVPATHFAEAAPAAQLGPLEMTTGTVVAVSAGTFQLERPALSDPSSLEQVTVQPPAGVSVDHCDIVSLTGRYNVAIKVLLAESLSKMGSACQKASPASSNLRPTDIDSSLDNDNEDDNDND